LFLKYLHTDRQPFESAADLLQFCNVFTHSCTFTQLEIFVRDRVNRWKAMVPIQEMGSLLHDDKRLTLTKEMILEDPRIRRFQSISLFPAHETNIKPFFQCPPECIKCMQIRESS